MKYEDQIRIAIQNGLFAYFGVGAIDVITLSVRYQQALHGVNRIYEILEEEHKGVLFMEMQDVILRHDAIREIAEKIEALKKYEVVNREAIEIQNKQMSLAIANVVQSTLTHCPKLIDILRDVCTRHIAKNFAPDTDG